MIDCKSRPVIFPRLARELVVTQGRAIITGRKRADFWLLELMMTSDDLPHIMCWEPTKRQWEAYPDDTVLQIMSDVFVNYDYEKILNFSDCLLLSWLNLYSSATFTMIKSRNEVANSVVV